MHSRIEINENNSEDLYQMNFHDTVRSESNFGEAQKSLLKRTKTIEFIISSFSVSKYERSIFAQKIKNSSFS